MTVQLLAFAQLADQLGFRERDFECSDGESARTLLQRVAPQIDLSRLRVAIDEEYSSWDEPLHGGNVVALIPPVSGG
jgi:molybdopterin synthase sulfur carrier subunit